MAENDVTPMAEEPTPQAERDCPLLRGDRYQGSGKMGEYPKLTTNKPFEPYGKGKMEDQGISTPTQHDHEEEQGQGQPEGQ